MSFTVAVKQIVREADAVLLIADARMPEMSMNKKLEDLTYKLRKKLFLVFNKIDLISQRDLVELKKTYPEAIFVSGNKNIGIKNLKESVLIWAKKRGLASVKVGVVGYPNVGKSSVINCLAHRARAAVSSVAGTTKGPQFVKIGEKLKIIDSPGVMYFKDRETKLGMIAAKNPEKLRNPGRVAGEIIRLILSKDKRSLEDYYKIEINNEDLDEIVLSIGKKRGFLKKGGEVDETKTAIQVIMDWQKGKLRLD